MALKIYTRSGFAVLEDENGRVSEHPISLCSIRYNPTKNVIGLQGIGAKEIDFGFGSMAPNKLSKQDGIPFVSLAAAKTYLDTVFSIVSGGGATNADQLEETQNRVFISPEDKTFLTAMKQGAIE